MLLNVMVYGATGVIPHWLQGAGFIPNHGFGYSQPLSSMQPCHVNGTIIVLSIVLSKYLTRSSMVAIRFGSSRMSFTSLAAFRSRLNMFMLSFDTIAHIAHAY